MDLNRAIEINDACCAHAMWEIGLREEVPPSLEGYSLREMLDAVDMVKANDENAPAENGMRRITSTCADRMIAGLYVLYNWHANDEPPFCPVARRPGAGVVVVATKG